MRNVQVVSWGSWKEWDCVRAALFSSSPSRISAAIDRITGWQSRGRVPVAVEITANIISIQQRDPYIRTNIPCESILPDEMLRMMYSMAIMRLINGVVDDVNQFRSGSVATRALQAELPRLLVDIRHDSAHSELPAISLLRVASKQALEWLEVFYWQQQKASLGAARERLKSKLMEYFSLLKSTYIAQEDIPNHDTKHFKTIARVREVALSKLIKLSMQASQDLISILVDDGLLEQHASDEMTDSDSVGSLASVEDLAWKYMICKLSSVMPQLLQMLVLGIVRRLTGLGAVADAAGYSFMHEGGASSSKDVDSSCSGRSANRLINWLPWLLSSYVPEAPKKRLKQAERRNSAMQLKCELIGQISQHLKQEILCLCLKGRVEKTLHRKLVQVVAAHVTSASSQIASRLAQLCGADIPGNAEVTMEDHISMAKLGNLESTLEETRKTQQSFLAQVASYTKDDEQNSISSTGLQKSLNRPRRWKVAENWQPCAVGMLPSSCYYGGVRPLLDCTKELCSEEIQTEYDEEKTFLLPRQAEADKKRKRSEDEVQAAVEQPTSKDQVPEEAAPVDNATDNSTKDWIDEEQYVIVKSIQGCILLNGMFQTVGPELLASIQREIRVL